jgi:FkbM family methyltransferase
MFSFFELATGELPVIRVVDIGAAPYGSDPYATLSEQALCEVIGFEPHAENCARRNAGARPGHRYFPYAVGDGRRGVFYECENPLTSSLYRPDDRVLENFTGLRLTVLAEHEVQTHRLDDLSEIEDIDYLKLDVQGAELDVIAGAQRLLASALVVHTEVGFIPLYADQPLFGDVDVALRKAGLWLHKLDHCVRGAVKPFVGDASAPYGQLLYADAAVYVRRLTSFDQIAPEKLLKLALILHEVYQSWDLAALALQHYDARTGKRLWHDYLVKVNQD